jgi:hypothetical protein
MQRLYALREENQFLADCRKINPDAKQFDRLFFGIREILERDPTNPKWAWPLIEDEPTRFMLSTREHAPDMPAMYVTFAVEKMPPDGLVCLRRAALSRDAFSPL